MEVQVFGVRKSAATRKALRYFSERRIRTHFVDLSDRGLSPRELDRFARSFGVQSLIDRDSRRFADLGLAHAHHGDGGWLELLQAEPLLLRMPLVRWQNRVTVGAAEEEWVEWVKEAP